MEKSFISGPWQQTRAFSPAVITKGEQTILASTLALRFRTEIFSSVGARASRAQYQPPQPPVGRFFLDDVPAPATAGDRAIAPPS
jgi:hypothetical protein